MQVALLIDPAYQQGQLATLYQRVYFTDNSVMAEKLPSTRFKLPVGMRLHYFWGDHFITRVYYRFYFDSWGNVAHTLNLEMPYKPNPFFSIIPFYRISKQSGIDYFAPYKEHVTNEEFFTSDYDLSSFLSHYAGLGLRWSPPKGILNIKHFNSIEIRYGHYIRSTDLVGNSITAGLKFK